MSGKKEAEKASELGGGVQELYLRLGGNEESPHAVAKLGGSVSVLGVGTFIFLPYWSTVVPSRAIPSGWTGEVEAALARLGGLAADVASGRLRRLAEDSNV